MNLSLTPQETLTLLLGVSAVIIIVFLLASSLKKTRATVSQKVKGSVSHVQVRLYMPEKATDGVELDQALKEKMVEAIAVLPNLEA